MPPPHISLGAPGGIRWILAAAGWLLPTQMRSPWLREWHAEFWHERASHRGSHRWMWARSSGAFLDAWYLLRENYGILRRLRDASHSRSAPVVLLVLLIAGTGIVADGFRQGRSLIFHSDRAGLVLLAQPVGFMGVNARLPVRQAEAWRQQGQTVAELGVWSVADSVRGGRHILVCRADAAALALLAQAAVKPGCEIIEPQTSPAYPFAGVVARLKEGVSIPQAERELAGMARRQRGWLPPAIVPLAAVRGGPLVPIGSVLGGLLLLSVLSVRGRTVAAWVWALAKIVPSFVLIALIWIDWVARAPFTESASIPGTWISLLYVAPVVAGGCAAWWIRRDQEHRCRVCHRALIHPVFVGLAGRSLFEPGGTEYLCCAGHGALLAGQITGAAWNTWDRQTWSGEELIS